jgi:tRNA A58 N-methylase Trm61
MEFIERGYGDIITVAHRDVCTYGFAKPSKQELDSMLSTSSNTTIKPLVSSHDVPFSIEELIDEEYADCIFLDVPQPWDAVCFYFFFFFFKGLRKKVVFFFFFFIKMGR